MESAIRLCYCCLLPRAPLQPLSTDSKRYANVSLSRFHHTLFNHASLCASHQCPTTLHPLATRSFPLANCTPYRFSTPSNDNGDYNNNNNNNVLSGMTGITLVLACVLGLVNFNSRMNPMFNTAYAASSLFPGGEDAVKSLLETVTAPELPNPNQTPPEFNGEPDDQGVNDLKLFAVGVSKSGNQSRAVEILQKECNKNKGRAAEFQLKLALVELLIIQGKFKEALDQLDQHMDEFIRRHHKDGVTDSKQSKIDKLLSINDICLETPERLSVAQIAHMILYKVILHTMLENKEAAKWLEAFGKILKED